MRPYPLVFRPILLPKVWGGDRLRSLGKILPPGTAIGESWELSDLASTAASGAGGQAQRSIIENGSLAGRTLQDAIVLWRDLLVSQDRLVAGGFPLLIKFLDARENLSVQVHPDAAYAAAHPGAALKTECWYIMDAAPGAVIYKGLKPGVTAEIFSRIALAAAHAPPGTPAAADLLAILDAVPARPGDCHNLPSGTVHALGAGVLVAEVQTPSDTTFRLYDWGRPGRELHLEHALACASTTPPPAARRLHGRRGVERLAETDFFVIDEAALSPGDAEPAAVLVHRRTTAAATPSLGSRQPPDSGPILDAAVLIMLAGEAVLSSPDDAFTPIRLIAGMTCLVPAAVAPQATILAETSARFLRVEI